VVKLVAYRSNLRASAKWIAALAGAACMVGASAAPAETWSFGAFHIDWPDGFEHLNAPGTDQFQRADGVGVTVDVRGHGPLTKPQEQAAVERWRSYAHNQLAEAAAKYGQVVVPLQEEKLASGMELFSLADEQASESGKSFGLFFLLISPDGRVVQIAMDGPGFAGERMREFRPVMDTAKWTAEP
jgi:hypothetical protein